MNKELQFLIYNTPWEDIKVNVVMRDETIWLAQRAMAELFGVQIPAINKHLILKKRPPLIGGNDRGMQTCGL